MKIKTKKFIAKEILLFFGAIVLTFFFFLCLVAWNYYLKSSINKLTESKNETLLRLEQLPPDRLKKLYDGGLKDIMIVSYQVGDDIYDISSKQKDEFLSDFPEAKKLIANSIGYTYRDRDSSFLFDFVSLDEFRNLMKDSIYRNGLFDFASTKYDLGTKEEYLNKVREGLINHEKTGLKALQYEKELIRIDDKLQFIKYNDIDSFVYIFGLILLGLLYPIRLLYYLIKWAIKTTKADTQ